MYKIDKDLILPWLVALFASVIVTVNQFYVPQSIYEQHTNELASKIDKLYRDNDRLQYLVDHPPKIEDLKLQLKLVADGASIEEAKQIIEVSKEAGVSPKW